MRWQDLAMLAVLGVGALVVVLGLGAVSIFAQADYMRWLIGR